MKAVIGVSGNMAEVQQAAAACGFAVREYPDKAVPEQKDAEISAVLNRSRPYFHGRVMAAYVKAAKDLGCETIRYAWLDAGSHLQECLKEVQQLKETGKIGEIGLLHTDQENASRLRRDLQAQKIRLYGVRGTMNLIDRKDMKDGFLAWCSSVHLNYWADDVNAGGKLGDVAEDPQYRHLYEKMDEVGKAYGLTRRETAIAWVIGRGAVPVVTCCTAADVQAVAKAVSAAIRHEDLLALEAAADACQK